MESAPDSPRRPTRSTGPKGPKLSVVSPAPSVDRDALEREVLASVAGRPDGLPPAELVPEVARRLGASADDIDDGDLDVVLGMLVVRGRIDEAGGRLVAVAQDTRATG